MERERFLAQLTHAILALDRDQPLPVAITGIRTSGKTTLADEIATRLRSVPTTVAPGSVARGPLKVSNV